MKIAAILIYPETVFIQLINLSEGCVIHLRYFTTNSKVDFCWHATVACIGLFCEHWMINDLADGYHMKKASKIEFRIEQSESGPLVFMQQLEP